MEKIILIYLLIINIIALIFMKIDKRRAEKKQWRIQEKTLFMIASIGGAIGILASMFLFRHKIRTWYFVVGIPILVCCNIYIIYRFFPSVLKIINIS